MDLTLIHNATIAEMFDRLADLLEIEGANPFRIRAYRNAARMIGGHGQSMADLLKEGKDLTDIPGIGVELAAKIRTIVETGRLPLLDELEARVPRALSDLMKIEGLGPKRVKALYERLQIRSTEDLERAARSGAIRMLRGFGTKTEELILQGLTRVKKQGRRILWIEAEEVVTPLLAYLRAIAGVKDVAVAGSFRRCRETVGDLDILVTTSGTAPVMESFVAYEEVAEVLAQGGTRASVKLRSGLQVDLRVVPQASYGAALCYFTGSKAHNIAVRTLAIAQGYKINEYGIYKGTRRVAGKTEEEIYRRIGLDYIEPELRENRGEIEAAQRGRLPKLVTLGAIRGDLHCHTRATDGHHTLEEMAAAARAHGYEYLAIADHSQHVTVAHGLDRKRLLAQIREIDRLNEKLDGIVVLKSIELDILEDGALDLPDSVLRELDLTVCSVHYKFSLTREQQTERILRAMDNPYFNILAHPTGRLINEREPYEVDLERILAAAKERGCVLEINAQPRRLDLNDTWIKRAKELGVRLSIATDAHSIDNLGYMRLGVGTARRGWLEATDVVNTRTLAGLRKILKRR